jgi:predicted glycosyltransferase
MSALGRASRVLFYVQHLLGIGHLARASRIADALQADGFAVTIITGGMMVEGFPSPGIHVVALPAIRSRDTEFSSLVDEHGREIDEALWQKRRGLLLATLLSSKPDMLIIEAYPFGRRQMRFELLPLLDAAAAMKPRPLIVSSIRDILQSARKVGRAEETVSLLDRFFDLVMVHGDRRFVKLEDSFPLADRIGGKLAYTGLVAPPPPPAAKDQFDVIVSCGGGAAAGYLLKAAIAAAKRLRPKLARWCVITGPNLGLDGLPGPLPANVEVFAFRNDFPALLSTAQLSISQAGYNTVCDILRARCRAVLVPFAGNGETEQPMRAERLASRGLAHVVAEADLTAETLTTTIEAALALPLPDHNLDLEGALNTAHLLRRHVRQPESYSADCRATP